MALKIEVELNDEQIDKIAARTADIITSRNPTKEDKNAIERQYTLAEIEANTGIKVRALAEHIRAGRLTATKPGGQKNYSVSESDLNKYLKNE
jgi:predicted site-specific integrase-resolvase